MENTNEVTVQIKVQNPRFMPDHYVINGIYAIPKRMCTVVLPSVEETEGEVKGYCIKRTPENAEVLNKWMNIDRVDNFYFNNTDVWVCSKIPKGMEDYLKPLIVNSVPNEFCILKTVEEFFAKVGYTPEPCPAPRTPIGEVDGQEVYEGDTVYWIDTDKLKIYPVTITSKIDWENANSIEEGYSKAYLTPEAVNARLKEIVIEKAKDYKFSISECIEATQNSTPLAYAIEKIEKEFNVRYL